MGTEAAKAGLSQGFMNGIEVCRAAAHGISGGIFSELGGGDFTSGFLAGFAGSLAGSAMNSSQFSDIFGKSGKDMGIGQLTMRTVIAATVGGTAAELGGGKFMNGAITAAIQHLFNHEGGGLKNAFKGLFKKVKGFYGFDKDGGFLGTSLTPDEMAGAAFAGGIQPGLDYWENAIVTGEGFGGQLVNGVEGGLMGALAFGDGIIDVVPFVDFKPFEAAGYYDSSQYGLGWSQAIGGVTRDAAVFLSGAAAWRAMPLLGGGNLSTSLSLNLSAWGFTPYSGLSLINASSLRAATSFGAIQTGRLASFNELMEQF